MCKNAAVKLVKQKTRETKEEEAEEVYVTQINLELKGEQKIWSTHPENKIKEE